MVPVRAGSVPTGQIRLEARVLHQVRRSADGDLSGRGRRLAGGVGDRDGDGVGACRRVTVAGRRAGLGADRRRAVAEVEAVAGDRGRSVSVEPEASAVTASGALPVDGLTVSAAPGGASIGAGADVDLRGRARRLPGGVLDRDRDRVASRGRIGVVAVAPACGPTTGEPSPKSKL